MALVTVNLSKVASLKTESSNAVDAGALASGSLMANLFNTIADRNKLMADTYWQFYAGISIQFVIAITALTQAHIGVFHALGYGRAALKLAIPSPCAAVGPAAAAAKLEIAADFWTDIFIGAIKTIMTSILSFQIAQHFFYLSLRKMAKDGHKQGIRMGHQLAFSNADIPAKLKFGSPPEEVSEKKKRHNFTVEYNKFSSDLDDAPEYTYDWQDGQEREHSVKVRVEINPIETFNLRTTAMPWGVALALLTPMLDLIIQFFYKIAVLLLTAACALESCAHPICGIIKIILSALAAAFLATATAANALAANKIIMIFGLLLPVWAGLLPGPVIKSDDSLDALAYTIAWIEDVEHNRRVRVDTWQTHQGQDLGQWQTDYPDLHSFSVIDFTGRGTIHPPALDFDSSIIATDLPLGKTIDDHFQTCPLLQKQTEAWEKEIASLDKASQDNQTEADKLDLEVQRLRQVGLPDEAAQLEEMANEMRLRAQDLSQQADDLEAKIEQTKQDNPDCFPELTG